MSTVRIFRIWLFLGAWLVCAPACGGADTAEGPDTGPVADTALDVDTVPLPDNDTDSDTDGDADPFPDTAPDSITDTDSALDTDSVPYADSSPDTAPALAVGLSPDFRAWLAAHGFDPTQLARDDLGPGGSFGGRSHPGEALGHEPVVFVHGNADLALGTQVGQTGWTASTQGFLAHGYGPAELYGTTWGPADAMLASQQAHTQANVMQVRRFLDAVLAYTGAAHVDVVAHSMGVTLARKAILGGTAHDPLVGDYDVGPPLTDRVDAFVAIAGANLGLTSCYAAAQLPTCGKEVGLYPGTLVGATVLGRSQFLEDLIDHPGTEGAFRAAVWSTVDEVIGGGGLVWGSITGRLPDQSAEVVYHTAPYGHFGLKDQTVQVQIGLVGAHAW